MSEVSNLKMFSIGIVVEDKKPLDDFIVVTPIESMSIQSSGKLSDNSQEYVSNLKGSDGKGFDASVKSNNFLKAKWISLAVSNRSTAPDVYKGESVLLFKFADVEEYFWTPLFREPGLRKQETVINSYSNEKAPLVPYTPSTSYYTLVDTRNKKVTLHTSNNDGELCTYDVAIDTKAGNLSIKDSVGNSIVLDSASGSLTVTTTSSINLKTANLVIDTSNVTFTNGGSFTMNTPCVAMSDNLAVGNGVNAGGGMNSQGDLSTNGNLNVAGSVTRGSCPCC